MTIRKTKKKKKALVIAKKKKGSLQLAFVAREEW